MKSLQRFSKIYFHRETVDFRKGINGLSAIVEYDMQLDPFEDALFVFTNSNKNKIKALYWDNTGFALWMKSLITDRYKWPVHLESEVVLVDVSKLEKLLVGYNPFQIKFKKKKFSKV